MIVIYESEKEFMNTLKGAHPFNVEIVINNKGSINSTWDSFDIVTNIYGPKDYNVPLKWLTVIVKQPHLLRYDSMCWHNMLFKDNAEYRRLDPDL